jgi:hypothetical protein
MADQAPPIDAEELKERILSEHREHPHPEIEPGAIRAHLLIHGMVEKQLAEGDPPETQAALDRLLAAGHGRHEAIHLIGEAVAREVMAMMREKRELDRKAFVADLEKIG